MWACFDNVGVIIETNFIVSAKVKQKGSSSNWQCNGDKWNFWEQVL